MSYVTQDQSPVVDRRTVQPFTIRAPFLQGPAGDVLARMTQALGVESCSPCEGRRRWLNEHLAFRPWTTPW